MSLTVTKKYGLLSNSRQIVPLDEELHPVVPVHPLLKGWATSGNDTVPLEQVERYIFGVEMGIGTPVVNGTLLVLNDNKNLFINGVGCTTCQPMGYFYDPALSSSHINCLPPER
jgi:hypothetical protein